MAEILGIGMSHFPGMRNPPGAPSLLMNTLKRPDIPEWWKDRKNWPKGMLDELGEDDGRTAAVRHREAFGEQCRVMRKALDDFKPDFVVIWGDDQYENFKEDAVPAFCVFAYDDMDVYPYRPEGDRLNPNARRSAFANPDTPRPNAWGEPSDTKLHVRGKPDGAKYLARGLLHEKVDVAYAYEPLHYAGLSHAFLNTAMFLDWDRDKPWDYPTVPFQINCYGSRVIVNRGGQYGVGEIDLPEGDLDPPGPTPERCMEVGAATARVLKRSPWRVALVASSSWSHAFLVPKHYFVYPDMEADRQMDEALTRGDFDYWRSVSNDEVDDRGHQELRNWWALVGAVEELGHTKPDYHAYVESYTQNSNKCFAIYNPR